MQTVHFSGDEILPETPVDAPFQGQVASIIVSPAGRQVLASTSGQDGAAVYSWTVGGNPVLLASMQAPPILALSDDGSRIYATDKAAGNIVEIPLPQGGELNFAPLSSADGVSLDPVGLALSPDNRYLLVADRATRSILVYETATGALFTRIPLDSSPTRLERVSVDPVFVLNTPGKDEWLMLLDSRGTPQIKFVPANGESQ
jgi:DNA-binding beta-propeller fold protein YncE